MGLNKTLLMNTSTVIKLIFFLVYIFTILILFPAF